jgi:hypothetical protein
VHHGLDVVPGEDARERPAVEKIANHQRAVDEAAVAGRQIVVDDWLIARGLERAAGVRADIARAARDENGGAIVHGGYARSAAWREIERPARSLDAAGIRKLWRAFPVKCLLMGNAKCHPTAVRRKPAGAREDTHRKISLTGATRLPRINFARPGNTLLTKKLYHRSRPRKGLGHARFFASPPKPHSKQCSFGAQGCTFRILTSRLKKSQPNPRCVN